MKVAGAEQDVVAEEGLLDATLVGARLGRADLADVQLLDGGCGAVGDQESCRATRLVRAAWARDRDSPKLKRMRVPLKTPVRGRRA